MRPTLSNSPMPWWCRALFPTSRGPTPFSWCGPANYSFAGYSIGIKGAKVYITDDTGLAGGAGRDNPGQRAVQNPKTCGVLPDEPTSCILRWMAKSTNRSRNCCATQVPLSAFTTSLFKASAPITNERQLGGWQRVHRHQRPRRTGQLLPLELGALQAIAELVVPSMIVTVSPCTAYSAAPIAGTSSAAWDPTASTSPTTP